MGAAVPVSEPALPEESALRQPKRLFVSPNGASSAQTALRFLPLVPFRIQPHSVLFRLGMHAHTPLESLGAFFIPKHLSLSETRVVLQGTTLLHKADRKVIVLIGLN